jgi:hypothetical protein
MPTIVTSSIGTSSRDYSTLQAWEDAAPADLVAVDQIWRGECYNDSEFTVAGTVLTLSGSTSDATRYKHLTTAAGQSFRDNASVQTNALRYNASNGVGIRHTGGYIPAIVMAEDYSRISRLQVQCNSNNSFTVDNNNATNDQYIDGCIIESANTTVVRWRKGMITNSLIIMRNSTAASAVNGPYNSAVQIINCTIVRPSDFTLGGGAIGMQNSGNTLKNVACFGFTDEVNSSGNFTATTCRTDKASPMSGFTTVAYDTSTGSGFQGIADAARDFRLKSTS